MKQLRPRTERYSFFTGPSESPEQAKERVRVQRSLTWTTKDDQTLKIVDMADGHLGNTLRFMERRMDNHKAVSKAHYNAMCQEARRRKLQWRADGMRCTFAVDGENGDRCDVPAVMLSPPDKRGHQAPRCEAHRQDALAYIKKPCDGCFRTDRPFVYETPAGAYNALLFCEECATRHEGPGFVALLIMVLTLGMVRR